MSYLSSVPYLRPCRTSLVSVVDRPAGLDENGQEPGGEVHAGLVHKQRAAHGVRVVALHSQLVVAHHTGGRYLTAARAGTVTDRVTAGPIDYQRSVI